MASPHNNDIDYDLLWSAVKWFFGGLSAIFSIIATALFGRMYREHNKMYESYISSIDPDKVALEDKIDKIKEASLEKYHKDVADMKHDFASLKLQLGPILHKIAEEEVTLVGKVEDMIAKFEKFIKKDEK
jgi:predicted nucleotide-binding protein (sugar kinase/HSP70/actin superfamily)